MAVEAVIFDWGGTLTPWHTVDHEALWGAVCASHLPAGQAAAAAIAILAAEQEMWLTAEREHRSSTIDMVFERAGSLTPTAAIAARNASGCGLVQSISLL